MMLKTYQRKVQHFPIQHVRYRFPFKLGCCNSYSLNFVVSASNRLFISPHVYFSEV